MMKIRIPENGLSLKYKVWFYFAFFSAAILAAIWLMQIVLLQVFYENMKVMEIRKIGDTIISAYHSTRFQETIYKITYNYGVVIRISDPKGNVQLSSGAIGDGSMEPPYTGTDTITDIISKVIQSNSGKAWYITTDDRVQGKILVYGAKLPDVESGKRYLLVNSQIAPIDSTSAVLRNQVAIIIAITLVLSLLISILIAEKMSRPITKITAAAKRLAEGDYSVNFEGGGYSEINQLAKTMNYATAELSKTDELRRELIANASHDLRTPLTMIKMYAELIRDVSGENPEKREKHTQVIIEETDRLNALLTDLLDLSKLQSGISDISRTEFDLTERVKTILNRFQVLAEKDGYTFSLRVSGETRVNADERKIEQVLYNLLSNAVNYTGEDKKVTVNLRGGNGKTRIEVIDTGEGIPADEIRHIWERYYKSGEPHKRAVVGTGLGLFIVKNILEAHHAAYGVESEVGKGSMFWFEL